MASFFDFQNELTARKAEARKSRPGEPPCEAVPPPLTVTQLTAQIDRVIKGGFPTPLLVQGEVSNYKMHSGSGHAYFTLKDRDACINCVMFKSDSVRLKFEPQDGMELLASGRLGVYGARGAYQLYVNRLEPMGQGALELAFRQLCEKLQGEGLFAAERKRPLPPYPTRIALVTSRQTAALQDMLKVLRRFPWLRLFIYHVPVQGEGAADQIAAALQNLAEHADDIGGIDLILLGRGGGSLEDLWPFNEELLARAIAASPIPIVTGIGHEIDVSVADLVADHHAHTPTEAAQVAVAQWRTARDDLAALQQRAHIAARTGLQDARSALASVQRHEFFRRPLDRAQQIRQRLDELESRLQSRLRSRLTRQQQRLHDLAVRLSECGPRHLLARKLHQITAMEVRLLQQHPRQLVRLRSQELAALHTRFVLAIRGAIAADAVKVEQLERHLNAVGPQQVLARGYSITTLKKGGVIVRSRAQVKVGQRLITRLADGQIESTAEDPNQGTLFE